MKQRYVMRSIGDIGNNHYMSLIKDNETEFLGGLSNILRICLKNERK